MCSHTTDLPQWLLKDFKWEIFDHPPYSPNLAPSNFHAFPQLKTKFEGLHFTNEKIFHAAVNALKKMDDLKKIIKHTNFFKGRDSFRKWTAPTREILKLICFDSVQHLPS